MKEGNDLFNNALNMVYCIRHMVRDHRDSQIENCFQLATRDVLYAPSHRQDSTYQGLCYTRVFVIPVVEKTNKKNILKEGSVLFNDALNTFSYGYMVSDI